MGQIQRVESVNELGHSMGFAGSAGNVGELAVHAGTASAVAREEAELKAAIVLARQSPRHELQAYQRIKQAMSRPSMAADARYAFPRGGQQVVGPSVYLAREAARHWGNLRYGVRIVSLDAEMVHVKGYCHDIETNSYNESEDKFRTKVQRRNKNTGVTEWVTPDERDLRELINKRGAICMRNSILQCLPSDVIEDAMQAAEATLQAVEDNNLKTNPVETIRKMADAFAGLGVTVEMLEKYIGHKLDLCTAEEITNFRTIAASLRDGQSKREDYFSVGEPAAAPGQTGAATLAERIKAKNTPQAATTPPKPTEKHMTPEEADELRRSMDTPSEPAKSSKTTKTNKAPSSGSDATPSS